MTRVPRPVPFSTLESGHHVGWAVIISPIIDEGRPLLLSPAPMLLPEGSDLCARVPSLRALSPFMRGWRYSRSMSGMPRTGKTLDRRRVSRGSHAGARAASSYHSSRLTPVMRQPSHSGLAPKCTHLLRMRRHLRVRTLAKELLQMADVGAVASAGYLTFGKPRERGA